MLKVGDEGIGLRRLRRSFRGLLVVAVRLSSLVVRILVRVLAVVVVVRVRMVVCVRLALVVVLDASADVHDGVTDVNVVVAVAKQMQRRQHRDRGGERQAHRPCDRSQAVKAQRRLAHRFPTTTPFVTLPRIVRAKIHSGDRPARSLGAGGLLRRARVQRETNRLDVQELAEPE